MQNNKLTVREIADRIGAVLTGDGEAAASEVTHDSRQVGEGSIFIAIKGDTNDGHRFIDDVMRRGAVGIISEQRPPEGFSGAWLNVSDARAAHAAAADVVFGSPSADIALIGITGTNGKTTTTYLCFGLAESAGAVPAMLTTVEYRIGDTSEPAVRTTPESSDTNRFLRRAVNAGCTVAVMEASSQALHLRRCDGLRFRVAVFTNLTRDHLDYHGTMDEYFDAKKMLFDGRIGTAPASSVINIDDEWGARLAGELKSEGRRVVTISVSGEADLSASDVNVSLIDGTSFTMNANGSKIHISSPLVGIPHVYNMLTAAGVALELGYDLATIRDGLATCIGAPGRFERVPHDRGFAVVVDYAHTDDALLNTLRTARELTSGRIITVMGCGGDRDRGKRRPMGLVTGAESDITVITSDNPRNEDPMRIIAEIEEGVKEANGTYFAISDRREAIRKAVSIAAEGDVVIIAGKGHENYQTIGGDRFHFDDREVAAEALALLSD